MKSLLCIGPAIIGVATAGARSKPNIILLLTDDQRDPTIGGMGHPFEFRKVIAVQKR